jgi:hypothetical protein
VRFACRVLRPSWALLVVSGVDHGMFEFRTNPDGTRTVTRITDGYLKLLADWIKGTVQGRYGRAENIRLGEPMDAVRSPSARKRQ